MGYDVIFLPAVDEPSLEAGFKAALPMLRAGKGHLIGCFVLERFPVRALPEPYWQNTTQEAYQALNTARRETLEGLFHRLCAESQIDVIEPGAIGKRGEATASFEVFEGDRADLQSGRAQLADLAILPIPDDQSAHWMTFIADDLLTLSGTPLLVVPDRSEWKEPRRLLVGWNGRLEASRALRQAVPFALNAEQVTILSVNEATPAWPSAADAAGYLGRKGVHVKPVQVDRGDRATEDILAEEARSMNADLLVIGAYSRPRWREALLGGVTRSMLRQPPLPVLLAN